MRAQMVVLRSMRAILHRFAVWLARKMNPPVLAAGQWSGTSFLDSYHRNRNPTPAQIFSHTSAEVMGRCEKIVRPVSASG